MTYIDWAEEVIQDLNSILLEIGGHPVVFVSLETESQRESVRAAASMIRDAVAQLKRPLNKKGKGNNG